MNHVSKIGLYYLFATLFDKGASFLCIPIFTRILPIEDYGIVTTYNAWVANLTIIFSLALYMSIRSSFVDYFRNVSEYLSVILLFTLLVGVSVSLIVISILYFYLNSFDIFLVILCLMQSISGAVISDVSMYLMMNSRYKLRTLLMSLPNFLSIVISFIVIKFVMGNDLYLGRVIPCVAVTALFASVFSIKFINNFSFTLSKEYILYGLKISLPLVPHGLALGILSQSDRIMISMYRSTSETAVYGLIFNVCSIATVFVSAFDGVFIPFFFKKLKECKYEEINIQYTRYVNLISLLLICILLSTPEIIKIFAPEQYYDGIIVIPLFVLSNYILFSYTFYVNIEHYYKKTVVIATNTIIASLVNIVLNLYFIDKFGYIGAATTSVLSYLLSFICHYKYAKGLNNNLFPISVILKPILLILIAFFIFYFFLNTWFIRWSSLVFFCGLYCLWNRELLVKIISKR